MNTMTSSTRLGFLATAILSALASTFAADCAVADSIDAPSTIVKYGDLNLSTPQDATVLYRRIQVAAEKVCRRLDDRDLAFKMYEGACVKRAIEDAVIKVHQPALFAIYNAKHGTLLPSTLVSQSR